MNTLLSSIHPYYIGLALSLAGILIYYAYILMRFRHQPSISRKPQKVIPEQLSPAAMRFLWKGEVDWDLLLTIAFSAVQKQVYRLSWNRSHGSAYFHMLDDWKFSQLTYEERAALTMGRNTPLKSFMFGKHKKGLDATMANRAETYLKKAFEHLVNPVQQWVLIGLIANVIVLLSLAAIFLDYSPWNLLLMAILMGFMIIGTVLYLDRFLAESNIPQKVLYVFMVIVMLGFLASVDVANGYPVLSVFALAIPVHILMFFTLPKLNVPGQVLREKIMSYREYLWKEKLILESSDIPYCLALEIPCDETEQIKHLLTEGRKSQNSIASHLLADFFSSGFDW